MEDSIKAYELEKRVEKYDYHMEIMHPNRSKMVEIPLDFMPFSGNASLRALDLGVGTGFFTKKFLESFPSANVVALDGAASMIDCAKSRLGSFSSSVDFVVADFRELDKAVSGEELFDVVFSSFALHHLTVEEKVQVLKVVLKKLKPGGLFFNADCIVGETSELEEHFQKLRVEGIVERAGDNDKQYKDFATTRALLDKLEAEEKDMPIKVSEELSVLSSAGFKDVDVLWKEYREAVLYGVR
jgi:tRNA (cmo5U34)-methyltransferase